MDMVVVHLVSEKYGHHCHVYTPENISVTIVSTGSMKQRHDYGTAVKKNFR